MGRHKLTSPHYALDRSLLPLGPKVTVGSVARVLQSQGWKVTTGFVNHVWTGRSRALTELGDAIREETARQIGRKVEDIWKEAPREDT